jgi:tetratricopeptide (TPR) repeat protein
LERALALNPAPTELRAQALIGLGTLARLLSDTDLAATAYRESLQISGKLSNQRGIGGALMSLGNMALAEADYEQANVWFTQAAAVWETLNDSGELALVWNNLGYVAQMQGRLDEARQRYEASLGEFRRSGDLRSVAVGLYNLAELGLASADLSAAARDFHECLDAIAEIRDRRLLIFALRGVAALAGAMQQWPLAVRLWSVSEKLRAEHEAPIEAADLRALRNGLAEARQAANDSTFDAAWSSGQAVTLDAAPNEGRQALSQLEHHSEPNQDVKQII